MWELAARLSRLVAGGSGHVPVLLRVDPDGTALDPATSDVIGRISWAASDVEVVVDGNGDGYVFVDFSAAEGVVSPMSVGGGGVWARAAWRLAGGLLSLAVWLAKPRNVTTTSREVL